MISILRGAAARCLIAKKRTVNSVSIVAIRRSLSSCIRLLGPLEMFLTILGKGDKVKTLKGTLWMLIGGLAICVPQSAALQMHIGNDEFIRIVEPEPVFELPAVYAAAEPNVNVEPIVKPGHMKYLKYEYTDSKGKEVWTVAKNKKGSVSLSEQRVDPNTVKKGDVAKIPEGGSSVLMIVLAIASMLAFKRKLNCSDSIG